MDIAELRREVLRQGRLIEDLYKRLGQVPLDLDSDQAAPPPGVVAEIRNGNKLIAIKLYREHTGVGLAEAKDAVEQIERSLY